MISKFSPSAFLLALICLLVPAKTNAYSVGKPEKPTVAKKLEGTPSTVLDRRQLLRVSAATAAGFMLTAGNPDPAQAAAAALQDSLDVDTFLKSGSDTGGNMGVSSQAGKSRPQTGVVFRDGSEIQQDKKGNVLAEILTGTKQNPVAVLTSFSSPWKLETGPVYDVECRDSKTGDGVFMAVTPDVKGKKIDQVSTDFLFDRLFSPTGRFSFYGPPTDIKVKSSRVEGNYRFIDISFSYLSQATNAEIPRKAALIATIPEGTNDAVMLVGSASASRWKNNGAEQKIRDTLKSFRAVPAPKTNMKLRPKQRGEEPIEF